MRYTKVFEATKGRDKGKKFKITEMPAEKTEWFIFRLTKELIAGGVEFDLKAVSEMELMSRIALSAIGGFESSKALEFFNEMMGYFEVILPDGNTRVLLSGDIEEGATLSFLRFNFLMLHRSYFDILIQEIADIKRSKGEVIDNQ